MSEWMSELILVDGYTMMVYLSAVTHPNRNPLDWNWTHHFSIKILML